MTTTQPSRSEASKQPILYVCTLRVIRFINAMNTHIGKLTAWLSVALVLLIAYVVITRALFDMGSLALQESITYGHATLFMLCMAYTVIQRGHVRVDVFYRRFNPVNKAWVDAIGGLVLLLPFALFVTVVSWDFVLRAWEIKETSSDPGGLPLVFALKTLIPITGILLALQAISEILRNLLVITFIGEEALATEGDQAC